MSATMQQGKLVRRFVDDDGNEIQPHAGHGLSEIYKIVDGDFAEVQLSIDGKANDLIVLRVEKDPSGSFKKKLPLKDGDFAFLREIERPLGLGADEVDHLAVPEMRFGEPLQVTDTLSGNTIQLGRVTDIAPR